MIWIITSIIVMASSIWFFFTIKNDFKRIEREEKELDEFIKNHMDNIP